MTWGKFPHDVVATLKSREWDNQAHLRQRLLRERPFPIEINLSPPSGTAALHDLTRFQQFIEAWQRWPRQQQVHYQRRQLHNIGQHHVPVALTIASMQELIESLGPECVERSQHWARAMKPLLALDGDLYPVLVRHLAALETLTVEDAQTLAALLPQLKPGMGQNRYLRALPIQGIDTKFIEIHQTLISGLLDQLHAGAISAAGGLPSWLGCRVNPSGWLYVRYLCAAHRERLGGFNILRLPTQELLSTALAGKRILIVENLQSGLALPELADTTAVCGGGQNLQWTQASWLRQKEVAYWGDIDTWGFKLLSDARVNIAPLRSLMMDDNTLQRFKSRTVAEKSPYVQTPANLLAHESSTYSRLFTENAEVLRLEQERLDADYIHDNITEWADTT
ncbi:MAG: hypothetical protein GKR94_00765 [Gammaproteobacteria bacterium]|nr:hypothetical protein [Gammaproteobacteria bacterium]